MTDQEERVDDQVLSALALGVDPVEPPPGLRDRILSGAVVVPIPRPHRRQLPLNAVAAIVVLALLVGAVIGNNLGHGTSPPPPSQVVHYTLTGHGSATGATADVTYLKGDRVAVVTFAGLTSVEAGKVYELWLITRDKRADSAGVFVPDARGTAQVLVNRALTSYSVMAVTVERGPSGTSAPTQQPQIYGNLN